MSHRQSHLRSRSSGLLGRAPVGNAVGSRGRQSIVFVRQAP
jgi:hypothetical protein